jgi:hypothetical protein
MFIIRWESEPPPDREAWITELRRVLASCTGSYHLRFKQGERGWRFDWECREDLGPPAEGVIGNSPDSVRFNIQQTLLSLGVRVEEDVRK